MVMFFNYQCSCLNSAHFIGNPKSQNLNSESSVSGSHYMVFYYIFNVIVLPLYLNEIEVEGGGTNYAINKTKNLVDSKKSTEDL
jgi:hypothetical protein